MSKKDLEKNNAVMAELSDDMLGAVAGGFDVFEGGVGASGAGGRVQYVVTGKNKKTGGQEARVFNTRDDAVAYGQANLKGKLTYKN